MKPIFALAAAAIVLMPTYASADNWTASEQRGVQLYELTSGQAHLNLVCDPEDVYGGSQNYLLAQIGGKNVHGQANIAGAGNSVTLAFDDGTAFKSDMSDEEWTALLSILATQSGFTLTSHGETLNITTAAKLSQSCNS